MLESIRNSLSRSYSIFYFALEFGKFARQTKSAVITCCKKCFYSILNQQSSQSIFFQINVGFFQEVTRNF